MRAAVVLAIGLALVRCRTRLLEVLDGAVPCCGKPGDTGNDLGVGKYCVTNADCAGQRSDECDSISAPNARFCTIKCAPDTPFGCGNGATCDCQTQFSSLFHCTCVPTECLPPDPSCGF